VRKSGKRNGRIERTQHVYLLNLCAAINAVSWKTYSTINLNLGIYVFFQPIYLAHMRVYKAAHVSNWLVLMTLHSLFVFVCLC
jgi:asparagine N-glycosylation enzyme membrane subunit Stt3